MRTFITRTQSPRCVLIRETFHQRDRIPRSSSLCRASCTFPYRNIRLIHTFWDCSNFQKYPTYVQGQSKAGLCCFELGLLFLMEFIHWLWKQKWKESHNGFEKGSSGERSGMVVFKFHCGRLAPLWISDISKTPLATLYPNPSFSSHFT